MSELKFDPVTGQPINQPAAQPGMQPGMPNMQQPMGNGPKFDPVTGQPIQPGMQPNMPNMQQPGVQPGMPNMQQPMNNGPKFNPVTGQPIQPGMQPNMPNMQQPMGNGPKFNPVTGQPVQPGMPNMQQPGVQPGMPNMQRVQQPVNGPRMQFDPKTGQPIQPANNGGGKSSKGLIIGVVIALIAVLGIGGVVLANGSKKKSAPVEEEPVVEATVEATIEEEPAATEATSEEVVAATEATTEEPEDKPVAKSDDSNVDAEDMFSFNFDGTNYHLPMPIKTLIDDGWTYNDDSEAKKTLAAGQREYIYLHVPGDSSYHKVSVEVTNFSLDALELGECYIYSMDFYNSSLSKLGCKVTVHNGEIEIGKSTSAEVKAIFGDPDYEHDSDSTYSIKYYLDHDDYNYDSSIRFSFENDVLDVINIENKVEPTDFEQTEVTTEKPAYLSQYEAPKSLGNDPLSGNFELDGKLYSLPVPFQEFLDDGWSYGNENVAVGAGQKYMITLTKGKQRLYVDTVNLVDKAVYLENTIVVEVSCYNSSYSGSDIKLPGGLTLSTNDENIKVILNTNNITNYTYKKDYKKYKIPLDQNDKSDYPDNYLEINMDDDGTIDSIDIQNYGWLLED